MEGKNENQSIFDRSYKMSVAFAVAFILISLLINYFAGEYATNHASNPVTDALLNFLPAINVTVIFVYGFVVFCLFVLILIILDLPRLPFVLKSIALFVVVRSIFVTLTHVGPSPYILVDFNDFNFILKRMIFSGDLFFSGHTGLPFLMSLIYWDKKYLRYIFLVISAVFGAIVLFGHLHYSIDVFAAFFITYGIFHMSRFFFWKDAEFFNKSKTNNTLHL